MAPAMRHGVSNACWRKVLSLVEADRRYDDGGKLATDWDEPFPRVAERCHWEHIGRCISRFVTTPHDT